MEYTDLKPMRLPVSCAVLSEEEMVYVAGGALALNISQEDVIRFSTNVVVNLIRLMGQAAINNALTGIQDMRNDGLTTAGAIKHYWGRQNTMGKVMTGVVAGCAGVYLYYQAVSLVNTFLSIYSDLRDIYNGNGTTTDTTQTTDVTASTTAALTAA